MWYHYQPGGTIDLITARDSHKTSLIRHASRVSLCVHCDHIPYRYVSVEGPVVEIQEQVTLDERRALARRYLGVHDGDEFVDSTTDRTATMVLIRVQPTH